MYAFFQDLSPEIKVTVAENSEQHSMTPTHINRLNLGVNIGLELAIDPPPPPGGILYTMIF